MSKTRNQNVVINDSLDLNLVVFNSNNLANVQSVDRVEIYKLDPTQCSDCNADGRVLVDTITDIENVETGTYKINLILSSPQYTIGKYLDVWVVVFEENDTAATIENHFEIFGNLFYTSTMPLVYSFTFNFQPNRIKCGSSFWLAVKIIPQVPRATDLEKYYTNLAISSDLKIFLEKSCDPCGNMCDTDLVIDGDDVIVRDKCFGFYKLDTREDNDLGLDVGLYQIWFELTVGDTVHVSDKMHLQIY